MSCFILKPLQYLFLKYSHGITTSFTLTQMMRIVPMFAFLSLSTLLSPLSAQIKVGEWRDHLSYSHATSITASSTRVYCATGGALFLVNKSDQSIEKLTKITGLSDIGISTIRYSPENELLFIAYSNANIDIIRGNYIHNISDIKRKNITGVKGINHILFIGSDAYLSCGFGIVVVNLEKREIKDTYYIGDNGAQTEVYSLALDGNFLYAATKDGILKADINNPNLIYFNAWNRISDIPGSTSRFNEVISFNNRIFVNRSDDQMETDTLYMYNGSSWEAFDTRSGIKNYSLERYQDKLIIASYDLLRIVDEAFQIEQEIDSYGSSPASAMDALLDENGILWIADYYAGMIKRSAPGYFESIKPNGPFTDDVFNMTVNDGSLYVAGGGMKINTGVFNPGEVYIFSDDSWQSIVDYSVRDILSVLSDPLDPKRFYAGSWGHGLLEYYSRELVHHYKESDPSTLQSIYPGDDYIRLGGLAFDSDHNLWITNSGVSSPVSVKKRDGSWKSFPYGTLINAPTITGIIVTQLDHKWLVLPRGFGLFAFDNNGTIDNENDDRFRKFSIIDQDGNTLNDVYSIAEDLEGDIWVGTNQGPLVYYNPENIFLEGTLTAQRIKVPRNDGSGLADYLLGTETITSIAVDGANRKWIGTADAGVFLLTEDGLQEIHHFNESNSPLLSNQIVSIAIDHLSGEVFFGTGKGVISFRSTATGGAGDFRNVYVFPNPVRQDYSGPITITGLVSNVNVKITDISGNIVFETTSLGGQAIWDGRNFSGDRVHSGVYLILCTNEDGSKTHIAKLLFLH